MDRCAISTQKKMDWAEMLNIYIYIYIGDWRRGKLIKRGGKINGGENSGSTTLILRGKVGRTVGLFQRRGQKEIVSAPFLTVRS